VCILYRYYVPTHVYTQQARGRKNRTSDDARIQGDIHTPLHTWIYRYYLHTHIEHIELPAKLLDYFYESRTVYVWVTNWTAEHIELPAKLLDCFFVRNWCCFYHFVRSWLMFVIKSYEDFITKILIDVAFSDKILRRNSLVALLEALCARLFSSWPTHIQFVTHKNMFLRSDKSNIKW